MGQPKCAERLLARMGMSDCKPVKTPMSPGSQLVKAADNEEALDQQTYQYLVGSLMYQAICTRPDIV